MVDEKMSMWTALSELFMERIDDLIYVELLVLSFLFALIMRQVKSGIVREALGALIGISLVYYFTGWKLIYSLIIVFINIALATTVKDRSLPLTSFLVTFGYLGLLRLVHFFGLPPLESHANAVQLIMTLRLVGLCFEISDSRMHSSSSTTPKTRKIAEPNCLEAFFYAYNFPGLFTGPYFTYAMHRDVVDNDQAMEVPVKEEIFWRLYNLIWALPSFILLVYVFPLKTMRANEFYDETVFYRITVSFFVFLWMRCRVYSAWMVAESICVLSGIGMYPKELDPQPGQGPSKNGVSVKQINAINGNEISYNSEAVRNLDIWTIEFGSTFRGGIRAWNRTVQFWLANFVYKRVPRDFGVLLTMSVSAFWHGVHPGYFLSFLTVPLCIFAEDTILSLIPKDADGKRPLVFTVLWYFIRQLGFTLMASGFLLLTWRDTIRYWNSVYFHVHCIMICVIAFCWLYKSIILSGIRLEVKEGMKEGSITEKIAKKLE